MVPTLLLLFIYWQSVEEKSLGSEQAEISCIGDFLTASFVCVCHWFPSYQPAAVALKRLFPGEDLLFVSLNFLFQQETHYISYFEGAVLSF